MMQLNTRVMLTSYEGKLVHAVLQRQVGEPVMFSESVNWEDVRELEITPDGKVVLSHSDGQESE